MATNLFSTRFSATSGGVWVFLLVIVAVVAGSYDHRISSDERERKLGLGAYTVVFVLLQVLIVPAVSLALLLGMCLLLAKPF